MILIYCLFRAYFSSLSKKKNLGRLIYFFFFFTFLAERGMVRIIRNRGKWTKETLNLHSTNLSMSQGLISPSAIWF